MLIGDLREDTQEGPWDWYRALVALVMGYDLHDAEEVSDLRM